jgi:type II secretory pathway pseudopilin PulG
MVKQQQIPLILLKLTKKSEKGLSFTEVLLSMTVSGIILAMLAPLFLISAAYRFNSLKSEQAAAVAQSEIDRVKTLMAKGVKKNETLGKIPPVTTQKFNVVPPPVTIVQNRNQLTDSNKAVEIDYDGDGVNDYFVQLFRDQGVNFSSGASKEQVAFFTMGVKVYSIAAKDNLGELDTSGRPASVVFTNIKDPSEKPLAVLYTEIIRGESGQSLLKYKEYLESL